MINDPMKEISAKILEVADLLRNYYDSCFDENEKLQRIRKIARRLCEMDGYNPDEVTMYGDGHPPMISAKGSIGIYYPMRPNWVMYVNGVHRYDHAIGEENSDRFCAGNA